MAPKHVLNTEFQHILRILNTNVDGTRRIHLALTAIRGVGIRFATLVCRKAGVDISRRAGELDQDEVERLTAVISDPLKYNIPVWFINRRNDIRDGQDKHLIGNHIDSAKREDLERLKKMRSNKGLRHFWGYRVRGQHTKTTGRYGLHDHISKLKK